MGAWNKGQPLKPCGQAKLDMIDRGVYRLSWARDWLDAEIEFRFRDCTVVGARGFIRLRRTRSCG